MDMMTIRRGLMAQMASGVSYARGTFTTDSSASTYTINFGKIFSRYLYLIEMTDASKTALMSSGQTSAKMYSCFGIYPPPAFDSLHSATRTYLSTRINPSTSNIDYSSSAVATNLDESSITLGNNAITGGANGLYRGYSYTYYVVEIK